MKVALVHDFLIRLGGAERVLKVLSDMYPHAPIYTLVYDEKKVGSVFPKERVKVSNLDKWAKVFGHKMLFPKMPQAVEQWDFSEFDLVISSSSAYAHGILVPLHTTHICYCHTPMRYVWDYAHQYLEEQNLGPTLKLYIEHKLSQIRLWDKVASNRPDFYIANSKTVAARIKKYYRRDSTIIYPPVDVDKFKSQKKNEDFYLIVSTLTPYKKIDLAIELFNKLEKRLVIIGGGKMLNYLKEIAGPTVDVLGRKPDEVVHEYIENCRGFIFPSEEDFGITPVEAMAAGKPILAYRSGGLTETMIEGVTGEFFDEQTLKSMEEGFEKMIANEKKYHASKIREQAMKFSVEEFKENFKKFVAKTKKC